jgi:hypothetical protein
MAYREHVHDMWMYILNTSGAIRKVSFGDLEVTHIMMVWPQEGCNIAGTLTDEAVKTLT